MTPDEAREQYPVLARWAYLNAGTNGPLARATVAAMTERLARDAHEGRGGKPYFDEMLALRAELRSRLAGLVAVDADRLALTNATTDSCNIVLGGLRLRASDEIVTTDTEHFGLLGALHASGARIRVARVRDRPSTAALEAILAEVNDRTRLIAISHVSWHTGHVLPLEELRAATELPLLVDGAQAVGAITVDAAAYDFYTVSGQKWLCGPETMGALYVADPSALAVAAPTYFAQQSYELDGSFVPREGAHRFDSGWLPLASLAGMLAALESHPRWGLERAAQLAARARELLGERFEVITEADHATLVTFAAPGDPAECAARALEHGVVIRDLPGTAWLRASCGYWTNEDDLQRLVEAV